VRAFICLEKPRSINNKDANKAERFRMAVRKAYRDVYHEEDGFWEDIYGIVYYFHRRGASLDADNLSKPVWDALRGAGFADDRSLKLRLAGIIDLDNPELAGVDLSNMPDDAANELLQVIGEENHVLYIEFGPLTKQMFRFGLSVSV
jgi:hypothetical protein